MINYDKMVGTNEFLMQNLLTEGQKKSEIRMESRLRGLEHLF